VPEVETDLELTELTLVLEDEELSELDMLEMRTAHKASEITLDASCCEAVGATACAVGGCKTTPERR
jgi:hypothetical protein